MLAFEIEDSEFAFGNIYLTGDICLCIEGDGETFGITYVFVERAPAEPWLVERMKVWVQADLALPRQQSRVRKAHVDRQIATRDEAAASYADHLRHERELMRAA